MHTFLMKQLNGSMAKRVNEMYKEKMTVENMLALMKYIVLFLKCEVNLMTLYSEDGVKTYTCRGCVGFTPSATKINLMYAEHKESPKLYILIDRQTAEAHYSDIVTPKSKILSKLDCREETKHLLEAIRKMLNGFIQKVKSVRINVDYSCRKIYWQK